MKIDTQKKRSKKTYVIVSLAIILIASALGVYAYYHYNSNKQKSSGTIDLSPATGEQKDAGEQAKSSSINDPKTNPDATSSDTPSSTNVNVQTTASAQNGTTYQLRYLIDSVDNAATCTLTLKNGSSTVTKTAGTQALAQSSTCQGFDIPTSELSVGTWQVTLVVSGGNISGTTSSTIQVQ